MERLTVNDLNKVYYDPWELCGMDNYCKRGWHEEGGCTKGCHILKMYRKLAEYEDLEEQGKLLKPKCLPGDYVWEINRERNIISEYEVSSIRYGINGTFHYMWALRDGIYGDLDGFWDKDIGKTVFLTKSAAETVLKEMEGKK